MIGIGQRTNGIGKIMATMNGKVLIGRIGIRRVGIPQDLPGTSLGKMKRTRTTQALHGKSTGMMVMLLKMARRTTKTYGQIKTPKVGK